MCWALDVDIRSLETENRLNDVYVFDFEQCRSWTNRNIPGHRLFDGRRQIGEIRRRARLCACVKRTETKDGFESGNLTHLIANILHPY